MADGMAGLAREADRIDFDPLTAANFEAFRLQASGALREQLDTVGDFEPAAAHDAWCYSRGGVIRGIGALSRTLPWRWTLWSFPGDLSLGDWKRVMRFTRLRLERRLADPTCLRIQATSRLDIPGAGLLLEHLGFELEGVMRCYGPRGEAFRLYAIVQAPVAEAANVGA